MAAQTSSTEVYELSVREREEGVGLMRISLEKGLFKKIDIKKVSTGAHYTEHECWLTKPVLEFIEFNVINAGLNTVLDPFAGDGHLLRAICDRFGTLKAKGFDLNVKKWPCNDSLNSIPKLESAFVCTNPPYLAKYSAKRKGVLSLVDQYFRGSVYSDLYQIAIERTLELKCPVIAIVPETFISSGHLRDRLSRVIVLERNNPFTETDTPVCVACFSSVPIDETSVYKDDEFVGNLGELCEASEWKVDHSLAQSIKFNIPNGLLALKAVDGTSPGDRIRFMRADNFKYRNDMIKVSSRLMTRISIPGLVGDELDALVQNANEILEGVRNRSGDVVLSPFKGNNKAGVRRRRLDYGLARRIIASCLTKGSEHEQPALF